jgi:DNA-binding transcriptional ArsR family regulator
MARMNDELFDKVASRFKALGEPARLRILDALRAGELSVGDLCETTNLNQANLSKHLQLLHTLGFVNRRKNGLFVYYALADQGVFQLCDIMCGRLEAHSNPGSVKPSTSARGSTRRGGSARRR